MQNVLNTVTLNGRQLKHNMKACIESGLVPFVKGQPGCGKSQIIQSIAEDYNLELLDLRLSGYEPSDFSLPFRGEEKAHFLPTDLIPIEGDPLPKGKDGWLLFLDEFNHAHPSMIRAAYKIVLDRKVGQWDMHENVIVVLAGNRAEDNALTNSVGSALNSRVSHLILGVDPKQWMEDYAIPKGLDKRIIGFLNMYPSKLDDFNPNADEQEEHSFCSPRTWAFVNKLIQEQENLDDIQAAVVGTISAGVAYEFIQFSKVYGSLISYKDIERSPESCPVPTDSAIRWATSTMLVEKVTEQNLDKFLTYIERFPIDNRIIFFRMVSQSKPEFRKLPAYTQALLSMGKYING